MASSAERCTVDPTAMTEEELDHELTIRGLDLTDLTPGQKVDRFTEHIKDPVLPSAVASMFVVDEVKMIRLKIAEMKTIMNESDSATARESAYPRLSTLYVLTCFRVRRSMFRDAGYTQPFKRICKEMMGLNASLVDGYEGVLFPPPPCFPDSDSDDSEEERRRHLEKKAARRAQKEELARKEKEEELKRKKEREAKKGSKYRHRKEYASDSSSDSSLSSPKSESNDESTLSSRSSNKKRMSQNPVSRWKLSYGPDKDLQAFLVDVEESAEVNEVSDDDLLRGISSLLTGTAKVWFRTRKNKIHSWKAFKKEIIAAFAPDDDEEEIQDKINTLKQEPDETFAVFEARMEELYARLSHPVSEKTKIGKLIKGLDLYYRSRIKKHKIDSLQKLRKKCRELDGDKMQIQKQEKDKRRQERKRDDREEKKFIKRSVKAAAAAMASDSDAAETDVSLAACSPGLTLEIPCWRCNKKGHHPFQCPHRKFCLNCGKQDTITAKCDYCAKAVAAGLWKGYPKQPAAQSPQKQGNASRDPTWGGLAPWSIAPPPIVTKQEETKQTPKKN